MDCVFQRTPAGFIPVDPYAEKLLKSVKVGDGVTVSVKKKRNLQFHRKLFALLQLAFDIWAPPADRLWRGQPITKNFERFREDVLIMAGHYDASYGLDGAVRMRAKSIAFANCDEHEFADVYSAVLNVVWDKILREANFKDPADVERVVNNLIAFEG